RVGAASRAARATTSCGRVPAARRTVTRRGAAKPGALCGACQRDEPPELAGGGLSIERIDERDRDVGADEPRVGQGTPDRLRDPRRVDGALAADQDGGAPRGL